MLSDLLKVRVTELGKVKIGGKGEERKSGSGGSYRMPVKLDHFIITTMHREKNGDLAADAGLMESLVEDGFGSSDGKLREIPIAVLSNDVEEIMQSSYVWYQGKRLAGKSNDGKVMTLWANPTNGEWYQQGPRDYPWKPELLKAELKGARIFKLHTTLNVVIAAKRARWGGVYKFRTTSQITAEQLYSSLNHVRDLTPGKILRGMPLSMVVRPMQVSPDGKTTTVYVVHIELRGSDLPTIQHQALELAKNELAYAREFHNAKVQYRRLLAIPGDKETPIEMADIVDEFLPSSNGQDAVVDGEIIDPLAQQLGIASAPVTPPVEPSALDDPSPTAEPMPSDAPTEPVPTAPSEPERPASEANLPYREPGWDEDEDPEEPTEPAPEPTALPQDKVDLIFTELRRLDCAWNSDSTRERIGKIVGREVKAGDPPSTLTLAEFDVLYPKLMAASKSKPKKAGAAS